MNLEYSVSRICIAVGNESAIATDLVDNSIGGTGWLIRSLAHRFLLDPKAL